MEEPRCHCTPRPIPWGKIALQAGLMWLATRVAFAVVTYISVVLFTTGFDPARMGQVGPFPPEMVFRHWLQWDTAWYMAIAREGYEVSPERTAFFPLYPLLIDLFSFGRDENFHLAVALVVANLAALAAFVGIGLLTAQEEGVEFAPYAIGAMAAYPFAFFMAAAYPESLFLALAVFSLFFARRGMWYWAASLAFFAALARPTGVVLILPLAWEYARQQGWLSRRWRERLRLGAVARGLVVAGAVPLALGVYAAYLWNIFGDPLVFLEAQASWGHQFVPPWELPVLLVDSVLKQPMWSFGQARLLIDVVPIIVFAALTALSVRRLPAALTLYMAGVLYVALASPIVASFDPFTSVARYLLAAFPAFLLLGRWMAGHPWLHVLVMSGGFMLEGIFTAFFLMGGWVI